MKKEEIKEEGFEDLLYTRKKNEKKKKKAVTKKIGKKAVQKNKDKRKQIYSQNYMDINISRGDDTPITSVEKKTENSNEKDINICGGDDTPITSVEKKKRNKTEWLKPKRNPTLKEERTLFGKALEILLVTCMNNHIYQFENKIRVQKQGGPIGLKLTGEIADCLMIDWDKKLLVELEKYGMVPDIYSRFKDDIQIAVESLEKGSKIVDNKLVIDENKKIIDENKTDTETTMEIIQNMANSISPIIKVTVETPCNFEDKKLPVLDIKVNVNEKEQNRIDFEFFEKPTKNPRVILADSALSFSQKRTILTQECLRRLRNT